MDMCCKGHLGTSTRALSRHPTIIPTLAPTRTPPRATHPTRITRTKPQLPALPRAACRVHRGAAGVHEAATKCALASMKSRSASALAGGHTVVWMSRAQGRHDGVT
eukprot:5367134-Prymnesium_polylepis.1